jgi:hypothetical protein
MFHNPAVNLVPIAGEEKLATGNLVLRDGAWLSQIFIASDGPPARVDPSVETESIRRDSWDASLSVQRPAAPEPLFSASERN